MRSLVILFMLLSVVSCLRGKTSQEEKKSFSFDADSAYMYIEKQVDFGARVPQSEAHEDCLEYLREKFSSYGMKVEVQEGEDIGYDGEKLPIQNLIASYNTESQKRILLCTHWDCRRWADRDSDEGKWNTSVMGADDGASGVGILLEVARQLSLNPIKLGVDFVCFDTEDQGTPAFYKGDVQGNFWCLGSLLWAKEANKKNCQPAFGILLDMVGGAGNTFYREKGSEYFAKGIVNKVWNGAKALGYSSYFPNVEGMEVTDDHVNVNRIAHIPCIDILGCRAEGAKQFPLHWHTTQDDMRNISRETLKAVGEVVLYVLYNE